MPQLSLCPKHSHKFYDKVFCSLFINYILISDSQGEKYGRCNCHFLLLINVQNSPFSEDLVDEGVFLLQGNVFALDVTNLVEDSFRVAGHGHFQDFWICSGLISPFKLRFYIT